MAKYSTLKNIIVKSLKKNPGVVFHIEGSPGTAKTALCLDIARGLGVPDHRILVFRPSIHDPIDLVGAPTMEDGVTKFCPPKDFYEFREGTGPGIIIIDELAQAVTMMQNALAGLLLDKQIGALRIDKEVMMISTGNRSKDKAGANKLVTQLGNRINIQEMEVSVDDTTSYFMGRGMQSNLIAFLRLRPELLNNFDPNRISNPTPRSWDLGEQAIPEDLSPLEYQMAWAGFVGEGAAAEWCAARDIMSSMPNPDYCIMKPDDADVPDSSKPAAVYAITTALAMRTDANNISRAWKYIQRLPREQQVVYMMDVARRDKSLLNCKEVLDFAMKNQDIFIG